ncbi:MAG: hypothetical protein JSS25_00570 [Proteobacteria bacterium]|nr:hypothetical protein [Pseudomonadota bacterium]
MNKIGTMVVVLALACGHAWAGEVHQCLGQAGAVSYVDGDCPAGTRAGWIRSYDDDRVGQARSIRQRQLETLEWQRSNRAEISAMMRVRRGGSRVASTGRGDGMDRCQRSRHRRDRIRDREFQTMTYDRMVALDDGVREACR